MSFDPTPIDQRDTGKLATTSITNELASAINAMDPSYTLGEHRKRDVGVHQATGRIVAAGPNGEKDFTDERYWVQLMFLSDATGAASLAVEVQPESAWSPSIVPITNFGERPAGMQAGTGNHLLPAGTLIQCKSERDTSGAEQWTANMSPVNGFLKLSSDWSPAKANIFIGNPWPSWPSGSNTTNITSICVSWPPGASPASVLKTGDVVSYAPFNGTISGSVFNAGTNVVTGAARLTDISRSPYVDLTQTGGSAGGSSSTCSFTYTAYYPVGGTNIAGTGLSPKWNQRLTNVKYIAASNGAGLWSGTNFTLMQCDELMTQTNCAGS